MSTIKVNPNRMELAKLNKRLKIASKGHKLMKDKQEQLVRYFLEIVKENGSLRDEVEESLAVAYKSFLLVQNVMGEKKVEQSLLSPTLKPEIQLGEKSILSLKVPTFNVQIKGDSFCYSPIETSVLLDESVNIFASVLKKMLLLAETEKTIIKLAQEIITTRRRVNALEYVLMPNIKEAIKTIKSKLAEMERAAIVQLMFVK